MAHLHLTDWSTPQNRLRAAEARGRPRGRVTGGWIADLAALGKAIVLCDLCVHRFKPSAYGYKAPGNLPAVRGDCDGCRQFANHAKVFTKAR